MIKILGQINDNKLPEIETERLCLRQSLVSEENYLANIMPKCWSEQKIPAGYSICPKGSDKVIGSIDFNHRHADDVLK